MKGAAHASIRGYLYQTCLGVLRGSTSSRARSSSCEGDEDLDRFLLDGGAGSHQVRPYTGGLTGNPLKGSAKGAGKRPPDRPFPADS